MKITLHFCDIAPQMVHEKLVQVKFKITSIVLIISRHPRVKKMTKTEFVFICALSVVEEFTEIAA